MYGQGGSFNPHYRHAAPLPPPPGVAGVTGGVPQQSLPPPPPLAGATTGGFPQQSLPPPPPPLAPYPQPPAMPPPPGPYQHGMPPLQNQAYPYAPMHHMPMLQQQNFGHMRMPGPPPRPPQAMYQGPTQYPMPGSLPPPPPRPPSFAPDNVPPPPPASPPPSPPSSPPIVPAAPPAAPTAAQPCNEEAGEEEGAADAGHADKFEEAPTQLIVSDDSDMEMDGDEDSPTRVHVSLVNSSPAAAESTGNVNETKFVNEICSLGNDSPSGNVGKARTENVTVEGGSRLQLVQGYSTDDSVDEDHAGAGSNLALLPDDNELNHPSDRDTEVGHQQLANSEENVNAAPCSGYQLEDERNPNKPNSDELGQLAKENLTGSESAGVQQSERVQRKRSRSPSQSSSPGRQSRSPLSKRTNVQQIESSHEMSLLPGQPLLVSSDFSQTQFPHNSMASANEFAQNQMRTYPAADLSHGGPLDFHPHSLQPVVPSQQQPAFHADEFQRPFALDSAPIPLPDGRSEFSGGAGLSYSSHASSYGQQQPPGSLASGANTVYPSYQMFSSNLPGNSGFGLVADTALPKSSIKPHYNPFASTFEQTNPSLDIAPVLSPNAVVSASTKAAEHTNTLSPFGQSAPGSGTLFNESFAEAVPNGQKQSRPRFTAKGAYDPLLDCIEPSSNSINKLDLGQETNLSATDSRNASKLVNIEVESKNMQGLGVVAESEVGEVAADTETGVVEDVSPEPLGVKDWSSDMPGDNDNDQSLKSKDSRSMKLFKIAIADFVKEVLKPAWRQGNMSREAFKIIVKKTVDKVSSSVPSNQIPKTPAKIKQYVQSSQRKVTRLVTGYVDRYVKQ